MAFSTFFKYALVSAALLLPALSLGGCSMQRHFDDPGQAVSSLVSSLRSNNKSELHEILGDEGDDILFSGDAVQDGAAVERFLTAYDQKHTLVPLDDSWVRVDVGNDDWPMPIPIVKDDILQKWYFDTEAGKNELLNRRIGRNELDTIQTCLAVVDAQRDYAETDPMNVGVPVYADRFFSDDGKKNGLYWPTAEGEPFSPLGELAAEASEEGYKRADPHGDTTSGRQPYHGYYYRILQSQGAHAPGGARDYKINGQLVGGFGLIALPASYGSSGVMTFIVNQEGVVYQRDLGKDTAKLAQQIASFDPGPEWKKVDTDTADAAANPDK